MRKRTEGPKVPRFSKRARKLGPWQPYPTAALGDQLAAG